MSELPRLTKKQEAYLHLMFTRSGHMELAEQIGRSKYDSRYFSSAILKAFDVKNGKDGLITKAVNTGLTYRNHERKIKFIKLQFVEIIVDGEKPAESIQKNVAL